MIARRVRGRANATDLAIKRKNKKTQKENAEETPTAVKSQFKGVQRTYATEEKGEETERTMEPNNEASAEISKLNQNFWKKLEFQIELIENFRRK